MIPYDFAEDLMAKIEAIISQYEEEGKIKYAKVKAILPQADYEHMYNLYCYDLPYYVRPASDEIIVYSTHYVIPNYYIWKVKEKRSEEEVKGFIKRDEENTNLGMAAYDYLNQRVSNYTLNYREVLSIVKKMDYWQGLEDEEKIILNYLNHYNKLLKSQSLVLDIGMGLNYPKEISDLFIQVLLRFLEHRLDVLNPKIPSKDISIVDSKYENKYQMIWKGQQNELAELIISLQEKGWIEKLGDRDFTKAGKSICSVFDISHTKKSPNTNEVNSFIQQIKGTLNESGVREFNFGKTYIKKFNNISVNNNLES